MAILLQTTLESRIYLSWSAFIRTFNKSCIVVGLLAVLSVQLHAQDCGDDALYVTPNGAGMGTKLLPAGLLTALAICKRDTSRHLIKLGTGTYDIGETLVIPSNITIDGSYDATNGIWKKGPISSCILSISPAGDEIKTVNSSGDSVVVGHYIGIMLDTVENIRFKDFTLQVHKKNINGADRTTKGDGKSIYGVFGRGSHDIYFINLHIMTDDGGDGIYGYKGLDGASANYSVPGRTVYDPGKMTYQPRPSEIDEASYEFRAGGAGGDGGRVQDYYRCLECPSSATSATTSCAPEFPLPRGGKGGKNGGLGGEAGENCEMDCYYEFYKNKANVTGELLSLLSLPVGGEPKDPTPDAGSDGQDGTGNYNGGDYADQTIYPYDDINYYYIPGNGVKGGDGSGGSGGGGGGGGGIRTLGFIPEINGLEVLNKTTKMLGAFNKAITLIGGDDVCRAEVVNVSTEGGRGGAGGEGGEGGGGGYGGGASIGVFAPACKNLVAKNCVYTIGQGGRGGEGGFGGKGGDGGLGLPGRPVIDAGWSYQGARGGNGGKGGDGSRGQHGKAGRTYTTVGVTTKPQPFIMSDITTGCTNSVISIFTSGEGVIHSQTRRSNDVNLVKDKPSGSTQTPFMADIQVVALDTGRLPVSLFSYPYYPQVAVQIKTIRPLPVVHAPDVICLGDTLKVYTDVTSASYSWKIFNANEEIIYSSAKQSMAFLPTTTGTYTIGFQAYDVCCGYSAPQYRTVRVSTVTKPLIDNLEKGLTYCYGSDSSRYVVTSAVNDTDVLRWSNGSTGKNVYIKEGGYYHVIRTTIDGCSAKSDSIWNKVVSLPQGKPSVQDLHDLCSGAEVTIFPDIEAGTLFSFYYQGSSKDDRFLLPGGAHTQYITFKPPIQQASASYFVRKVSATYLYGTPFYCTSDEVQEVKLYKETYPPVITSDNVKHDLAVDRTSPGCGTYYTYDYPKALDSCSPYVSITVRRMAANHFYPIGTTVDTLRYTDVSGNYIDYAIPITVHDVTPPVITSKPATSVVVNNEPGTCGAYYPFTLAMASDNCTALPALNGVLAQTVTSPEGGYADLYYISGSQENSVFNVGNNVLRQSWADAAGNVTTFEQSIVVKDAEAPKLQSSDLTYYVAKDKNTVYTAYNAPRATDNCSTFLTSSFVSGFGQSGEHPIGTSREIWKAVDGSGNEGLASFNIVVLDTISPTIDCSNVRPSAYAVAGSDRALVTFSPPVALDNGGSVTVTTSGPGSGAYYELGIHHLPYVATDNSGNTATCIVTVTVMDVEAPNIVCPSDIKVINDPGLCGAAVSFALADALDNDGSRYTPYQALGQASGNVFPVGTTLLAFKVADAAGNTNTCGFNVTVEDTEAPRFTNCPGGRTEFVVPELCGKSVALTVPAATDNSCSPPSVGLASGSASFFPIGITHQVYRASDKYGNVATCEFDVEVIDNTTLSVTCPRDIEVNTTPGLCGAVVVTAMPTANLNYGCLEWQKMSANGIGDLFIPGAHTVTYMGKALGQTATCSFKVTVMDVVGPKIAQPDNIVVTLDAGECGKAVTFPLPVVTDNCTNHTLQQTAGLPSGSVFPVGTTTQKFIAFDNINSTSISFTVTVLDTEAPVFANVPDVTETIDDICGKVMYFATPTATDNSLCFAVTQLSGLNSGDRFPVGVTRQRYMAKDAAGNIDTVSFVINLISTDKAQFNSCPPDVVVMSDNGLTKEVWYDVPGRVSCAGVTAVLISGKGSGATFPAGETRETYLITDASGKTDTCSFKVFVAENVGPYVNCSPQLNFELDDAICGAKVKLPVPAVDDFGGSGLATIFNDFGSSDSEVFMPAGYSQVNWTAVDKSGNRGYCTTFIQVGKDEAPMNGFSSRVTVCEGSDVEINPRMSGEGPYVYQWVYFEPVTFEMKVVSTDSIFRIPNVQISDARQYMLAVMSPCNVDIFRKEFLLTVKPAPKVTLTGLDAGYCEYQVTGDALSYSPAGGVWVGEGLTDGKFYPSKAGAGQHTISYTYHDNALGCPATASLTTEVYATPVVNAFIDTAYCVNTAVLQLDATNSTYAGAGISGTTFNAAVAQPGTHTLTRTVKVNGCVNSRSTDVRIQGNVPDASILTAGPICSNKGRVELKSVTAGGNWSGVSVLTDSARAVSYFNVNAAELGDHKVYYKLVDDVCIAKDSVTITVINSSYDVPYSFNAYCYDQGPVALDVSDNKNYFGYGIDNNKFNPAAYDTTATALYGVSTKNSSGCIDTVWRAMAVLKPELIDPLKLVCKRGDAAVLSVNTQLSSVTWFDNTTGYTKTVYDTGNYIVELRNTTGCVKVDTFLVDSKQAHLPPLINDAHELFKCTDATATLAAGGNYVNYVWADGTPGRSLTVSSAGEYKIFVKDDTGCELYDSIQVNNYPAVTNNQLANNGTYLEAIPSTAYVWYRDGLPVDGASGQTLPVTESGAYYVMITDGNGCQSASDTLQVVLTAIEGEANNTEFMIYPNPSKGKYVFEFKSKPSGDLDIVLINTLGQIVQQFGVGSKSRQSVYPINIESQPAGVYWALIKRGDQTTVVKLVKVD